jgi:hypothetical protein
MRHIKSFNVLQTAKVLGALYFALGLVFLPFVVLSILTARGGPSLGSLALAVFSPLIYGVLGFVLGALVAWLYNIIAKQLGGIEVEVVGSH